MITSQQIESNVWVFNSEIIPSDAYDALDAAIELWHNDEVSQALNELTKLCSLHLDFADAYYHLGLIYSECERPHLAFVYYQTATAIWLNTLGNDFSWSQSKLEWGFIENRPFLRAYHALGLWYLQKGKFELALLIFERIIQCNPNDNQGVRYLIPQCLFSLGNAEAIITLCQNYAHDIAPEIIYSKCLALVLLEQYDDAKTNLIEAMKSLPLVAKELLKKKHPRPKSVMEGFISMGGADQAYLYWQNYGNYWKNSASAMQLLEELSATKVAAPKLRLV